MTHYNPGMVSELPTLERSKLHDLWKDLFNGPVPPKLRREWLIRVLTYRIQEKIYGGLKPEVHRELIRLGERLEKNPGAPLFSSNRVAGTQLVREWKGKPHTVTATDDGSYEYQGKRYKSLSVIARLITGTRWSGPLFFGLRKKSKKAAR